MKTTQKTRKTQNVPPKKKSELRHDPPTHFRVFIGFLNYFNLKKPLRENEESRILKFVKSFKIRNLGKYKHSKITRSKVYIYIIIYILPAPMARRMLYFHRGCAYTVRQTIQRPGLCSIVYVWHCAP